MDISHRKVFILTLSLFCLSWPSLVDAQDNFFSQFFANRIYLNPAFAGLDRGVAVTTSARNQWYRANKGYSFTAVSAEWQEGCWNSGFGLSIQASQEGLAPLFTGGVGLTYAYLIPYRGGNVHVGLQYGFIEKRMDWSRLTFSDQLDPIFGNVQPSGVEVLNDRVRFHDFSFGAVWRFSSRMITRRNSLRRYHSHLGFAVHHLASLVGEGPDESFSQTGVEVPARITLHGGTIIPLTYLSGMTKKVVVSPNFRFETQGPNAIALGRSLTLFSAGSYFIYDQAVLGVFYNSRSFLPGIRNTTSFTASIGFIQRQQIEQKQAFYIGLSADINATGVGIQSGSVFEMNLRYNFRAARPYCEMRHEASKKKILDCKDFY